MKKIFEAPVVEIIKLTVSDVITTSVNPEGGNGDNNTNDDIL